MSMVINTNLDALNAQRNLATTGLAYSKSVAKLSSGMRINSAADDAAGLTISEKLRAQTAGLAQASRNAQDGISMIQTGEGALNETASILQRMRELTVQGGNDTLQASDRGAIKGELDQLSQEVDRISSTTQFNGKTLLNGSLSAHGTVSNINTAATGGLTQMFATTLALSTQAIVTSSKVATTAVALGTTAAAAIGAAGGGVLSINGTNVTLTNSMTTAAVLTAINGTAGLGVNGAVTASFDTTGKLALTSNTAGSGGTVSVAALGSGNTLLTNLKLVAGTVQGLDVTTGTAASGSYTINITQAATNALSSGTGTTFSGATGSTLVINGTSVSLQGATSQGLVIAALNSALSTNGIAVTAAANALGTGIQLTATDRTGSSSAIVIGGTEAINLGLTGSVGLDAAGTFTGPGSSTPVALKATNGTQLSTGGMNIDTTLLSNATNGGLFTAAAGNSFTATLSNTAATLQIGANFGQTLQVGLEDMGATALGVNNLDVSGSASVNLAGTGSLAKIDRAIATVSAQRATLGAYQNRLEHTISNLGVSQSNLTASESRIRDVDMAAEMVNFTKTGILQQAGQAILAQANQSGSGVMSLLRG
jgi:flagellin